MFQVERLYERASGQPSARHVAAGRVWVKVGKPVSRLAVAERIQKNAMTDGAPSIVRIRPIART
jgi:hypothetical protein